MKDERLIPAQDKDGGGGSAIEKMNAADHSLALDEKAADAMARQPRQIVFPALERHAGELNLALEAPLKVFTQPQKTLSVPAKSIQPDRHPATIGPKHLVAFEMNGLSVAITGRFAPKDNRQSS